VNAQLDLPYRERAVRSKVGPKLASRMIAVLIAKNRWVTRAEFAQEHGFSKDGRECRLGRAASNGRIIHGQKGYRLNAHATVEERAASQHDWQAQIAAAQRQLRLELIRGHAMVSGGYRAGMDSLKAKGA